MRATILAIALLIGGPASAATFHILYDDSPDEVIGTDTLVGVGTFSYDGAPVAGAFALSSLSNLAFSATISGRSWSTADIVTPLSTQGIVVFDIGDGEFGMVFTGSGDPPAPGSFNLANSEFGPLTHEPTPAINDPIGCCGGNGSVNRYISFAEYHPLGSGDYAAITTPIPEPSTLTLCLIGLLGLAGSRRRYRI